MRPVFAALVVVCALIMISPAVALAAESGGVGVVSPLDVRAARLDDNGLTVEVQTDAGVRPFTFSVSAITQQIDRQLEAVGLSGAGERAAGTGTGSQAVVYTMLALAVWRLARRIFRRIGRLARL